MLLYVIYALYGIACVCDDMPALPTNALRQPLSVPYHVEMPAHDCTYCHVLLVLCAG